MFKRYHIELKADDFLKGLNLLQKDMKKIARRMISKVSVAIKKDVRNNNLKGGLLKRQEGLLLKSLKHKASSDFIATILSATPYSSVHEEGATILPKNGKYLAFQIDGVWKRAREINIPKRTFLWPVINDYFTTGRAEKLMDEVLNIALKEIFKED